MQPAKVIIRPAIHKDLDDLVGLLQDLFALETDFVPAPERQRRGLKQLMDGCGKHRCLLVAEDTGAAIAMVSVQVLISTAEGGPVGLVEDVVVKEACRGHGVGRRLMTAVSNWAEQHGLTRLQLLADRHNRPALDFYTKLGWQPTQLICLRQR